MKNLALTSIAAGLLLAPAYGKVSFSLDIEALAKSGGTALSNSGLLVLVVDAGGDGMFSLPSEGSLVGGDDEVVATWDLAEAGPGTSDLTLLTEGGVTWGANWDAGEKLGLFWFPNLSTGSAMPSASEEFGFFTAANGLVSGDSWTMPSNGTLLHSLKLFTASATKLVMAGMGEVPDGVGVASYAVGQTPATPTSPTIAVANNGASIVVSWSGGNAAGGGYIIQRRASGSGDSGWRTVGVTDGAGPFTDNSITPGGAYDYQLIAMNGFQTASSSPEAIIALRSRITNLSSRAAMKSGLLAPIMGIAVQGSEPLRVISNAVGPSMGGTLAKPEDTYLQVKYGINPNPGEINPTLFANDDWELNDDYTAQQITDAITSVGGTQLKTGFKDASLILDVEERAGGYVLPVRDPSGAESICSLQVYDLSFKEDPEIDSRLTSLSTRAYVGTGPERLIGSFFVNGAVPMTVAIRAKGPAVINRSATDNLTSENVLDDPQLVLRKVGTAGDLATNDNWEDQEAYTKAEILEMEDRAGLISFEDGSKDSTIIIELEPNNLYSVIVSGVDSEVGITVLEIYEVPAQ